MGEKDKQNYIARKKFEELGLSYRDIGSKELFDLINRLDKILPENDFTYFKMKVSRSPRQNAPRYFFDKNGCIKSAFIRCDGPYFKGREAISFNPDGFIGFAAWADTTNTKPFTETFMQWCEDIAKRKEKENERVSL